MASRRGGFSNEAIGAALNDSDDDMDLGELNGGNYGWEDDSDQVYFLQSFTVQTCNPFIVNSH